MKILWGIITGLIGGFIYALTKKDTPESETMAKKSKDSFNRLDDEHKLRVLRNIQRSRRSL